MPIEEVDSGAPITTRALAQLPVMSPEHDYGIGAYGGVTNPNKVQFRFSSLFNSDNTAFNKSPLPVLKWANAFDVWEVRKMTIVNYPQSVPVTGSRTESLVKAQYYC